MKPILTIARRELKALFDGPAGYVLLVVFLVINAFLFFRQAYLTNTASLRPMLDLLPWILLFFVPAVFSLIHGRWSKRPIPATSAMPAIGQDGEMG